MEGKEEEMMTTDPNFHMMVEDVFSIRNRGTVVTGKIDRGMLGVGDQIIIKTGSGEKTTTVNGIEKFHKVLDSAREGDTVGILLKDITKNEVQRGDELHGPNSDFTWKP
jgi:elongation factor Tu